MQPIIERYLDGRLVKETAIQHMTVDRFDEYHPGRHRWLLDGTEITEAEALAMIPDAAG